MPRHRPPSAAQQTAAFVGHHPAPVTRWPSAETERRRRVVQARPRSCSTEYRTTRNERRGRWVTLCREGTAASTGEGSGGGGDRLAGPQWDDPHRHHQPAPPHPTVGGWRLRVAVGGGTLAGVRRSRYDKGTPAATAQRGQTAHDGWRRWVDGTVAVMEAGQEGRVGRCCPHTSSAFFMQLEQFWRAAAPTVIVEC